MMSPPPRVAVAVAFAPLVASASAPATSWRALPADAPTVGPCCALLTAAGLRSIAARPVSSRAPPPVGACSALLQVARAQVKGRARAQAEWTYARAVRAARRGGGGGAWEREAAEAAFALALVAQKRDVELARAAFQLSAAACDAARGEARTMGKVLVSWGLFESKQSGGRRRAQRLLERAVRVDPTRAPVLKWKCLFPGGTR